MKFLAILALLLSPAVASAQVTFTVTPFSSDISGSGQVTLTWSAPSAKTVQIRIGSAGGPLFAEGGDTGLATTGDWVTNGMQFYLQDVTIGAPGVTLAAITAQGSPATFKGSPQPFIAGIGTGLGQITLTWSAPVSVTAVEIHVGSPSGTLLTGGSPSGSVETGPWVTGGLTFYLQDVSRGSPGRTLAVFAAHSPALPVSGPVLATTIDPTNPTVQDLVYSAPGATEVEIHIDKPWGQLLAQLSGPSGSAPTGSWLQDGMRFYLQDVSNGHPLTSQYTLATTVVTVYPRQLPTEISFGVTPGVIPDPGNKGLGTATVAWNAKGYENVQVRVNSPDGQVLTGSGPEGSAITGNWITPGMRFYLQDASPGVDPTSEPATIAVATVDLQPSDQHFVSFATAPDGVLIYSRESGYRIGNVAPNEFAPGVTAIDLHPSLDGTLLYMMGSDFNYYVLDPSTDTVVSNFPVNTQPATPGGFAAFASVTGPQGRNLLVSAPDPQGNISIVDPVLNALVSTVNCQCSGNLAVSYSAFNQTTYFFDPRLGVSSQVAGLTQNLQLTTPISLPAISGPLTLPTYSWNLQAVQLGSDEALLMPSAPAEVVTPADIYRGPPQPIIDAYVFAEAVATVYDVQSASVALSAPVNPGSASPDGRSIYGWTYSTTTVPNGTRLPSLTPSADLVYPYVPASGGCYSTGYRLAINSFCVEPSAISRYQLGSSASTSFTAATFNLPPLTVVFPPSAFDDQYAYLKWASIGPSTGAIGPYYIHKADPLTLQPAPNDNPVLLLGPTGGVPTNSPVVGAYTYTGTGP